MSTTSSADKGSASSGPASPAPHAHTDGKCPVTGASASSDSENPHPFCPPQEGDIRSVCPALNTMANHGYIRRDGRSLSSSEISTGLRKCYGLSLPLSAFLAHVGFLLLHKLPFIQRISLHDVSYHGRVEHDASLVHHDTPTGETYAPEAIDPELVDRFFKEDVKAGNLKEGEELRVNAEDVGRSRVRRERECRPIGAVKQEIARGEMAIILGVWSSAHFKKPSPSSSAPEASATTEKVGAPAEWIRRWLSEERLPEVEVSAEGEQSETKRVQWTPTRVHGFGEVVKMSKAIRAVADGIRKAEAEEAAKTASSDVKK